MSLPHVVLWCMVAFAGCVTIAILAYVALQAVARRDVVSRVTELEVGFETVLDQLGRRQRADAARARRAETSSPPPSDDDEEPSTTLARGGTLSHKQRRNMILNLSRGNNGGRR